jgi:hypothetical protein
MLKNIPFLVVALIVTNFSLAQKKEKIKGSKIVTVAIKEINNFENIEVSDNFEVLLVKANQPSIEIEADDNLHEIINFEVIGNTLKVNALKDASSYKKFTVRINYSDNLKLIVARNEVNIKALAELELDNVTIKNYDESKSFLNVKSTNFSLILDDKSEAEINLKSEKTTLELSKSSELKVLITSPDVKIDMYQKSEAIIEGTTENARIRLDNSCKMNAQKYAVTNLEIDTDNYAKCEVNVTGTIKISAAGKSQIELFGAPKITVDRFTNNATIYKKEKR